jgi:hypothetical protein
MKNISTKINKIHQKTINLLYENITHIINTEIQTIKFFNNLKNIHKEGYFKIKTNEYEKIRFI